LSESKCPCLSGGKCLLSQADLDLLQEQRQTTEKIYREHESVFLSLFSDRYGANAKFNRNFPGWLKRMALAEQAQHVVLSGFFQSGFELDGHIKQEVIFISENQRSAVAGVVFSF
jgi:hypothetical protein